MNIEQALQELHKGKKIRHKSWPKKVYVFQEVITHKENILCVEIIYNPDFELTTLDYNWQPEVKALRVWKIPKFEDWDFKDERWEVVE